MEAVITGSHQRRLPSSPVLLLLRLQSALTALLATHSNVESPSSLLRIPNSTSKEPAPAVQVSLLLSGGTPFFRLTCEEGKESANSDKTGCTSCSCALICSLIFIRKPFPYILQYVACNVYIFRKQEYHCLVKKLS